EGGGARWPIRLGQARAQREARGDEDTPAVMERPRGGGRAARHEEARDPAGAGIQREQMSDHRRTGGLPGDGLGGAGLGGAGAGAAGPGGAGAPDDAGAGCFTVKYMLVAITPSASNVTTRPDV